MPERVHSRISTVAIAAMGGGHSFTPASALPALLRKEERLLAKFVFTVSAILIQKLKNVTEID